MRPTLVVLLLLAAPSAAGLPLFGENDAGSGGDVGDTPAFAWPIERGVLYAGDAAPLLDTDMYLVEATIGERIFLVAQGADVCADLRSPNGTYVGGACDLSEASPGQALVEVEASGIQQIVVTSLGEASYRFGLDVLGDRALPNDDAGTGHDAPDFPADLIWIERGIDIHGDITPLDADHYAFTAAQGETFDLVIATPLACLSVLRDGEDLDGVCATTIDSASFAWTAPATDTYQLLVTSLTAGRYRFGIDVPMTSLLPPLDLEPAPAHPARGADPTCGTGAPVVATSGEAPELDGLVWAALKTGFRAAVAWRTSGPVASSLTYSLDGGASASVAEPFARTQHVFVLDSLPEGATLCFTPEGGAPHAIRLANAMHDLDPTSGTYTANLLIVANTQPTAREDLEGSLPRFAETLYDMTDGHVQAGKTILVYADVEKQHHGIYGCYLVVVNGPGCSHAMDVVYTYDSCIGGSACTTLLGVKDRQYHVWMNSVFQANAAIPIDDTGRVLAHEMGHYLLGALDLYGSVGEDDCWDPAKGLSVMGGDRDATELDDETNRCPNEAQIEDYTPSWTLLRAAYPSIPERSAIDAGPSGAGDAFSLHVFANAPGVATPQPDDAQNDAGSGGDAPDDPDAAFLVEPGVVYDGLASIIDSDHFAFHAAAGARIDVATRGPICASIANGAREFQNASCASGAITHTRWIAPSDGIWYLVFDLDTAYRFSFGVNAPATVPIA